MKAKPVKAQPSAPADLAGTRAPYWLLARGGAHDSTRDGTRLELFTVESTAGKALLVFGSEYEAELFLRSQPPRLREGFRTRETWATELLSVLSGSGSGVGPCAGVERIAFNPPPESADAESAGYERAGDGLACVGRRVFLEHLMGRGPFRSRDQ